MVRLTHKASMAEARGRLSILVNMVAHGHERVVLTSRGRPKAAIVGLDDLAALEDLSPEDASEETPLQAAKRFRQQVLQRRKGKFLTDSVKDLEAIRDEHSG